MVPGGGLEPPRCYQRGILNPLCLPISPPGRTSKRIENGGADRIRTGIVRICNPLHRHSATAPYCPKQKFGAGNEVRTRDLNLGKVALYQLSYTRINVESCDSSIECVHSTFHSKTVN